jgi:2-methylaconitate cis-trans-isomerase PrpF
VAGAVTSMNVMLLANVLQLKLGPDMWLSYHFIQISQTIALVSQSNRAINIFLSGLGAFSLNFGFIDMATGKAISFTDQTDRAPLSLEQ